MIRTGVRCLSVSSSVNRVKHSTTGFYSSLGGESYKALQKSNVGRWQLNPVENVNEIKAGSRKFSSKVVDLTRNRPECSFPMTKLNRPTYDWDHSITQENKNILKNINYHQHGRIKKATDGILKGNTLVRALPILVRAA